MSELNNEGNKDVSELVPRPEWARRRRLLYAALLFIAGWLSYILFKGTDSVLYQQSAFALIGGAVMLIGQYIFGAAWDDKNYMDNVRQAGGMSRRRHAYQSSPDRSEPPRHRTPVDEKDLPELPPLNGGDR